MCTVILKRKAIISLARSGYFSLLNTRKDRKTVCVGSVVFWDDK
jgi:hypothetical protein